MRYTIEYVLFWNIQENTKLKLYKIRNACCTVYSCFR